MKKRLYSVVLLFSFFCCSGGFLVARAEDPGNGNTGVLPTTLVGTLNFANGEAMLINNGWYQGYAYINGSYQILYESKVGSSNTSDNKLKVPSGWDVGSFTFCFGALAGKSSFTASYVMAQPDGVYCISFEVISGDGTNLRPSSASTIDKRLEVIGYSGSTVFLRCLKPVPLNVTFNFTGTLPHSTNGYVVLAALNAQYLGQYSDSGTQDIIDAITDQTGQLDQSITDAGQGVQDKIESQYDASQGSEVGSAAQGFADQAAESLGVVSYIDTLFSGLSGLVTAGSTTLTFPAFAIAVQGTDYQVWQEHTFDLSQLDGWFSGLMAAVRLATSVVVVGAVIHYLQSVYKDVIG